MRDYIPFENILYIEEINRTFTVVREKKFISLYELRDKEWFLLNGKQEPLITERLNSYFKTNFDFEKEAFLKVDLLEKLFNVKIIDCYGDNYITIETNENTLDITFEDMNKKIIEYIVKNNYFVNIKENNSIYEYRLIENNKIVLFKTINKSYHNYYKTKALFDIFSFIIDNDKNHKISNLKDTEGNIAELIIVQGFKGLKEYENNEFVILNHLKEYFTKLDVKTKFRSIYQMADDYCSKEKNSYSHWVLYLSDFKLYIDLDGIYEDEVYIEKIAKKHNHNKDLVGFVSTEPVKGKILEIKYKHLINWFEFCNLSVLMIEDERLKNHLSCDISLDLEEECPF